MANGKMIKAVIFEPNKKPRVEEIKNELETYQEIVHGYIECIKLSDDVVMICNDEGKLNGSLPNRYLGGDTIFDTFVVVGDAHDGDFESLTDDEIDIVSMILAKPIDTQNMSAEEINSLRNCDFNLITW